MTLKDIELKIIEAVAELNSNPTIKNYIKFEHLLDFYSDVFKDEYGFRPSIGGFRDMMTDEAFKVRDEFESLPNKWELYCDYSD